MSLLFHERTIRSAVAGELSPPAEETLRAHLRRCPRCRARYDALSGAVAALAAVPAGMPSRLQAQRERARLIAAIPAPSPATPRAVPARSRPWRGWTVVILAPVAALGLWLMRPVSLPHGTGPATTPGEEIQWRGAGDDVPAGAGSLVIYAARKQPGGGVGPLRVVAELPGSGQGRVSLSEYVAFGVRDLRTPAFVTIVGVQDDGTVHIYLPRPSGEKVHAEAGPEPTVFRPSINLAASHRAGRLVIRALFSSSPLDPDAARQALARSVGLGTGLPAGDSSSIQVGGVLIVEP